MGCPKLWPSAIRLTATLAIFIFHFLGLLKYHQYRLDFYAIVVFSFLSGYLSSGINSDRQLWLKKRYLNIMVPYWIVIIPILCATIIFSYKPISWLKVGAALSGCNMFIDDPVYVISWYITFVMLLYLYIFIESLYKQQYIFIMLIGLIIFSVLLHKIFYFIAFVIGIRLASHHTNIPILIRSSLYFKVSRVLFVVQKYCYPFFLIHGGVLLIFTKKATIRPIFILLSSFVLACAFSVILHAVSQPIQVWAIKQWLKQTAQPSISVS